MENKIKVSIIIPVYGVEKYIRCCAESLFAQTLDDIEFLFIKAYLSLRLFAKLLLFHGVSVRYKIKSFIQMIFDIARTNKYLKKYRCKGAFMDL